MAENTLWTPKDDLPDAETLSLEVSKLPEIRKYISELLRQPDQNTLSLQEECFDKSFFRELLVHMKEIVEKINNNPEIKKNGFTYPVEWLESFKAECNKIISSGGTPDVGIVGYGSLRSPQSLAITTSQVSTGMVKMQGIKRGLYLPGFGRIQKYWKAMGLDPECNSGVMAVKYDSKAVCSGIRIPFPGSREEWERLLKREDWYEFLPGPPAKFANGEIAKLNLICWPIGRSLMNQERGEIMEESYKNPVESVRMNFITEEEKAECFKLKTTEAQAEYLEKLRTADQKEGEQLMELEKGVAKAYEARMAGLCSLRARPLPDMAYVNTCLEGASPEEEEDFLKTTFCYNSAGEEITLWEYLRKHAPKTNPKLRPGDGGTDGHPRAGVLMTQSHIFVEEALKKKIKN